MTSYYQRQKKKEDVKNRAAQPNHMYGYCRVMHCGKPARAGTAEGLDTRFCRSHYEHYQRHGSPYQGSFSAVQINPYRQAALLWILNNEDDRWVKHSIAKVETLYRSAGPYIEAFRLRGLKPKERAKAHWARLRKHKIEPRLVIAAWLAVEAIIKDDPTSANKTEYKQVQAAKIVHRMASGTHKRWEHGPRVQELHVYPRPRGKILRHIGADLQEAGELLVDYHLDKVIALKHKRDQTGAHTASPYPSSYTQS